MTTPQTDLAALAKAWVNSYGRWLLCKEPREKDARKADVDAHESAFTSALAAQQERIVGLETKQTEIMLNASDAAYERDVAREENRRLSAGVWVPVSPTQEQVQAATVTYQGTSKLVGWLGPDGMYARIYRAMIAAKP